MKRSLMILMAVVMLMLGCGCTHNGGPSGDLYGRWHVERVEADGMEAPQWDGEWFWSFQSDMVQMQLSHDGIWVSVTYGLFNLSDHTLLLSFPEEKFPPFVDTGLQRENTLYVVKLTGTQLVVTAHPEEGATLTYYLRKW